MELDPDRLLRRLLGLPGRVLDLIDGGRPRIEGPCDPAAVYPLVRAQARYPEAHLALERGLSYVVEDEHVFAYRLERGTAFGIGGLNAPPGARGALLRGFAARLRSAGVRRTLVFPVRRDELEETRAAGFDAIQVGVEAWLDLPDLTFRGSRFETVRHMRNVARRRGVVIDEAASDRLPAELDEVYRSWLDSKRPRWRMRLLVGSPGLDAPFDRRYLVARTADRIEGFVTLVPGGPGIWGIDVMCRRPDAPKGTMEALVVEAVERLRAESARALSLGPCPMAEVPLEGEHPVLRRVFRVLYASRVGHRVFAFQNLHRFKQKFRPRWEPVYFAASPRLGFVALYAGCRMWGLY